MDSVRRCRSSGTARTGNFIAFHQCIEGAAQINSIGIKVKDLIVDNAVIIYVITRTTYQGDAMIPTIDGVSNNRIVIAQGRLHYV